VLFISYMDGDSEKAWLENIYLGDIILSINDKVVNTLEDLRNELERINSSDNMKIYYLNTKSTRIYFKKK
jgi:S1-C subfamily serine protease